MKPTQLVLTPSRRLAVILALVSFTACTLVIFLPFIWQCKAAMLLVIIPATAYSVACDALLILPWSCSSLTLNKDNDIFMTQKNGRIFVVNILPTSLITSELSVINLCTKNQFWTRSIVILADSALEEEVRLWRVWLKWSFKDF